MQIIEAFSSAIAKLKKIPWHALNFFPLNIYFFDISTLASSKVL